MLSSRNKKPENFPEVKQQLVIQGAFATQKYGTLTKRQTDELHTIPVIGDHHQQSTGEKYLHETKSAQSA